MMRGMRRLLLLAPLLTATLLAAAPVLRGRVPQPAGSVRLVAIGDIHGAADAFARILQKAGLIDASQHWSGGTATLVQTGDYLDRGGGVRQVLDLLMRLEGEAKAAGAGSRSSSAITK